MFCVFISANSDEGSSSSCLLSSSIMYGGPLSFINVSDGREDADDGDPHCIRNVVEAAVVFQLTRSLIQGLMFPSSFSFYRFITIADILIASNVQVRRRRRGFLAFSLFLLTTVRLL